MKNKLFKIGAIIFWVLVWQVLSMVIGHEILLASPASVLLELCSLVITAEFWKAVFFSFIRIVIGFLIALFIGAFLAGVSYKFKSIRTLLWPLMSVIKTAPVVSFIILCLIWISSKNLSIFISFLMVLPIIFTNILKGLENTQPELLEMSEVFKMSNFKKVRYIFIPSVYPFMYSACQVALGLCWKAGITAELIGIPTGSIGEKLYQTKLYLSTGELFAWTIVIIVVSAVFEKFFLLFLRRILKKGRNI